MSPLVIRTRILMPEVQAFVQQEDPKWSSLATLWEFIDAQAQNPTFQHYAATVRHSESRFYFDINKLLVRQSTINDAIQNFVLKTF